MSGEGLVLDRVSVTAGGREVLDRHDLRLPPGSTLVVTGPPGSGKSSVLATVAGVRTPDSGSVRLDGRPVVPGMLGRTLGYLPQPAEIIGTLTAAENVALTLLARGVRPGEAWSATDDQLAELGLPGSVRHNLAEQLSGGQRLRVAFARAVVGGPALLVADDPTNELDPQSSQQVATVLRRLTSSGCVVVLSTTDPALAAVADLRLDLSRPATSAGPRHSA